MTQDILIIQLGLGGVGQALVRQVLAQSEALAERYGFHLSYLALVERSGALYMGQPLKPDTVRKAAAAKQSGQALVEIDGGHEVRDWRDLLPTRPCIVVDVTAADAMEDSLTTAVAAGHRVVLANKRPLTGSMQLFKALTRSGATRYEATVGAGLPTLSTLRSLLDTGDQIQRIEASMSGTLGYIGTALEEGVLLSKAVRAAHSQGLTEPDPRDDLSGADVARKALILARTLGLPWNMSDVPRKAMFPPEIANIKVDVFLERLTELDAVFADEVRHAREHGAVLRYVATVEPEGADIAFREVPLDHPLATLRGSDNLFAFTTARYAEQPLVVRGAGAGVDVTAAGVLGDIVSTAREW